MHILHPRLVKLLFFTICFTTILTYFPFLTRQVRSLCCVCVCACVGTFPVSSSSMDSITPKFIVIHRTEVRGSQLTAKLNEGEGRAACRDTKLSEGRVILVPR